MFDWGVFCRSLLVNFAMKMRRILRTWRRLIVFLCVMIVMGLLLVRNSTVLFSKKDSVTTDIQNSASASRQIIRRWRRLPVHVVEEHHEVLPYWFRAADHGRISKGVTLIHIDGHSDMATNYHLEGYPFFQWPLDSIDINIMMQRNDAFITAAAMAGLITNFVWIWPKWDQANHNESRSSGTLQLGWTITKQTALGSDKAFCMCIVSDVDTKYCTFMSTDETNPEVEMEEDECFIKTSINYTEVREDVAKEYLESLHGSTDNMILDIDEDFFGCEYASQPLHDLLVPDLSKLDEFLYQLFCPLSQNGEAVLDKFLTDLIKFIKHTKCKTEHKHRLCENKTLKNTKKKFMKRSSIWKHYTCKTSEKRRILLIGGVIEELFQLNRRQLTALQRVGFCLSTSRKSYQPINPSLFVTCRGANSPNETAVTEHRTNAMEVTGRGRLLDSILRVFKKSPPKLITVCRSIRDGYTPRKYFTKIEHTILKAIRTNYHNVFIHHDNGLLGGKKGFKQYD